MESPPTVAPAASNATSPRPPIGPSKLRLMCSYGGHIVPRPHGKSLFYAGGETRIVAFDRRTTAASLSALTAHLSRVLFHNRAFHLKYQLPNEDLDSLISVITDEDLANMVEEHDRIIQPARIRLFLFPVKPESLGTALLDPKSESWFSDVLKSTQILQKGQSADSGMLMGIGSELEASVEIGSVNCGGDGKLGAESLVLETNSSFGSTSSSFSTSNSPPIVAGLYDERSLNLQDREARVPSSNSLESVNSAGSLIAPPKTENFEEPLIQVGPDESSENPVSDTSFDTMTQKTDQVVGYALSQNLHGMKQQHEAQLTQGGPHYGTQYASPVPMSPYYPLYQMPMQQLQHIPYPANQPCPIYLVPVKQTQYHNLSMQYPTFDATTISSSSRVPMHHPQTLVIAQSMAHREIFGAQIAESSTPVYYNIPNATQLVSTPSNQGPLITDLPEPQVASEPVKTTAVVPSVQSSEFDEDIAYNQIYKTQPSPPILSSQYPTVTKDTTILSEPLVQMQPNHTTQQAPSHPK